MESGDKKLFRKLLMYDDDDEVWNQHNMNGKARFYRFFVKLTELSEKDGDNESWWLIL